MAPRKSAKTNETAVNDQPDGVFQPEGGSTEGPGYYPLMVYGPTGEQLLVKDVEAHEAAKAKGFGDHPDTVA